MPTYKSAADECGWRQFPRPRGPIRIEPDSPDYYAEADLMEKMVNWMLFKIK